MPTELRTRRYMSRVEQNDGEIELRVKTNAAETKLWGGIEGDNLVLTNFSVTSNGMASGKG